MGETETMSWQDRAPVKWPEVHPYHSGGTHSDQQLESALGRQVTAKGESTLQVSKPSSKDKWCQISDLLPSCHNQSETGVTLKTIQIWK